MIAQSVKCDICSTKKNGATKWCIGTFLQRNGVPILVISDWEDKLASKKNTVHLCGEGHAHVYLDQWFEKQRSEQRKIKV